MPQEITRDQLVRLAQDMVAASQLQTLYGIGPFMRAKIAFEEAVCAFEKQTARAPQHQASSLKIGEEQHSIPDFLKFS